MKTDLASPKAKQMVVPAYSFVEFVSLEELLQLVVLFPMLKLYLGAILGKVHPIGPGCAHQVSGKVRRLLPFKYRTFCHKSIFAACPDTTLPF